MPTSSNNNESVQQNVSPGSSGPNHQGMPLPSVPENEDMQYQQQSISTIPSSLFGANTEHEQPAAAHAYMGTGLGADREHEVLGSSLLASQFEE